MFYSDLVRWWRILRNGGRKPKNLANGRPGKEMELGRRSWGEVATSHLENGSYSCP